MKILLLSVIRARKDDPAEEIIEEYCKRIKSRFELEFKAIKPIVGDMSSEERKKREGELIFKNIADAQMIVACDERGKEINTDELCRLISTWQTQNAKKVAFIIGGADGLDAKVLERATFKLSLSKMTLAHRIAAVVLAEQLYRVSTIIDGHPYSH